MTNEFRTNCKNNRASTYNFGLSTCIFWMDCSISPKSKIEAERKKANVKFQQKQWEKEQIDNQIAEFYGPISALLQEQNTIFGHILNILGRKRVFLDSQIYLSDLPENEQKIWVHYVDTYIIPINKEIVEIIR